VLIKPLHAFLEENPFETNVFGMTRFPGQQTDGKPDPIGPALGGGQRYARSMD